MEEFSLLKMWMQICDEDHECVSARKFQTTHGLLPTRVIDVGKSDGEPMRLVRTDPDSRGKYLALSHKWGNLTDDEKFCASKSKERGQQYVHALMQRIPFQQLPKSFQDAVRVTRALGIQYLWVDSLCIVQDDTRDWELESKKMEDVFSNAYCTIAASSAESSLVGFLNPRQPPRDTICLPRSSEPLYLAEHIDNFSSDVEKSALSSRGWVFQERALSRRTIYFTNTQVYWECGRGVLCETLARLYK